MHRSPLTPRHPSARDHAPDADGAALQASELRYRLAAARGQVWDWTVATGRLGVSAEFWAHLDFPGPAEHDAFAALRNLLHPDDVDRLRQALTAHLARRVPYDLEFRARHADGRWLWFHTHGHAIWDDAGRATYMAGMTYDITDRKQTERQLLEAEAAAAMAREALSKLTQRLLSQERVTMQRLAQALHDHLGQTLGAARLNLDAFMLMQRDDLHGEARAQAVRVAMLLDQAVDEVRRVLADLRPPLLEAQGLMRALDIEIGSLVVTSRPVDVLLEVGDGVATLRWPPDVEYSAFMIAREAIANAQRHAGASLVRVLLDGTTTSLHLQVVDDGCGIPGTMVQGRPGHLGIVGMRERAIAVAGRFFVGRDGPQGTVVSLRWSAAP